VGKPQPDAKPAACRDALTRSADRGALARRKSRSLRRAAGPHACTRTGSLAASDLDAPSYPDAVRSAFAGSHASTQAILASYGGPEAG
jgi:hypothetical protein